MAYRCPYCHEDIGDKKLPSCPACGKAMRYAMRRTPTERRDDKRKLRLMEKQALRKRSAFDAEKVEGILQSPRKVLWIVFILGVVTFLFFKSMAPSTEIVTEGFRQHRADFHLNTLATALARYHFHTGQWPSTNTGLNALLFDDGAPGWDGPYLNNPRQMPVEKIPLDPWRQPYVYTLDTNGVPVLFSQGTDGIPIYPDPKAYVLDDMSWTNEWVSAEQRKPIRVNVLPAKK